MCKALLQEVASMDVMITLNRHEAELFQKKRLLVLFRQKGLQNITSQQKVFVCLPHRPLLGLYGGVLGELQECESFRLWIPSKQLPPQRKSIQEETTRFQKILEKEQSLEALEILKLQNHEWGLIAKKCKVFDLPYEFSEFTSSSMNPLREAPIHMQYVHTRFRKQHGLCMTKEEFVNG